MPVYLEGIRRSLKEEGKSNNSSGTATQASGETIEILAPLEGKAFLTKDSLEKGIAVGDKIEEGDIVCYIEAMKVTNAVKSDKAGNIEEICFKDGDDIYDDDAVIAGGTDTYILQDGT